MLLEPPGDPVIVIAYVVVVQALLKIHSPILRKPEAWILGFLGCLKVEPRRRRKDAHDRVTPESLLSAASRAAVRGRLGL